jgi:hypothetical protein
MNIPREAHAAGAEWHSSESNSGTSENDHGECHSNRECSRGTGAILPEKTGIPRGMSDGNDPSPFPRSLSIGKGREGMRAGTEGELSRHAVYLPTPPCTACRSRSSDHVWRSPVGYQHRRCRACGHVYRVTAAGWLVERPDGPPVFIPLGGS